MSSAPWLQCLINIAWVQSAICWRLMDWTLQLLPQRRHLKLALRQPRLRICLLSITFGHHTPSTATTITPPLTQKTLLDAATHAEDILFLQPCVLKLWLAILLETRIGVPLAGHRLPLWLSIPLATQVGRVGWWASSSGNSSSEW